MRDAEIVQLRRELRSVSASLRKGEEKQRERRARQTEIMRRLVANGGLSQAEVGRDAGVTRMAVSLRLEHKPRKRTGPRPRR